MLVDEILKEVNNELILETYIFTPEDFKEFKCKTCVYRDLYIKANRYYGNEDKFTCKHPESPVDVDNYDEDFLCKYFENKV